MTLPFPPKRILQLSQKNNSLVQGFLRQLQQHPLRRRIDGLEWICIYYYNRLYNDWEYHWFLYDMKYNIKSQDTTEKELNRVYTGSSSSSSSLVMSLNKRKVEPINIPLSMSK